MNALKQVIFRGKVRDGYFVCESGHVWTNKSGKLKKLATSVGGGTLYPRLVMSENGKPISTYAHRVVCETIHPFPIPEGVSKTEWKNTPEPVKQLVNSLYQVNHIDHDQTNHHPSNLEWVTVKQNAQKYQEHRTRV